MYGIQDDGRCGPGKGMIHMQMPCLVLFLRSRAPVDNSGCRTDASKGFN